MSNSAYNEKVLAFVNNFRVNPASFQKLFQTISKALKRSKKDNEGTELEDYSNELVKLAPLSELKFSKGLQRAAEDQLLNIIKGVGKVGIKTDIKLKERTDYFTTSNDSPLEMADQGDLENFICRICISDLDPSRRVKEAIRSEDYKFIGIASCDYKEDPVTVMVIAKDVVEMEEIDYGEDTELKEAFDLFDVYHTGKIDQKSIKAAFEALGFDKDSYSVYRTFIMMDSNKQVIKDQGVNWPIFRDTIKSLIGGFDSKEGLRSLFELFVDSPDNDKITAATMRRVAKELDDKITYDEIVKILQKATQNGNDIDFEEFYSIMQNYKELHTESTEH